MKIIYPSIDKLLDKVNSRYSSSVLTSKRVHELEAGNPVVLDKSKLSKLAGQALEETAAGKVTINPNHKTNVD